MHEEHLIGLAIVITLSMSAQWISWRVKMPSILLLLVFGIMAGPVTGILHVDKLMGDLLFPVVSLSVGIILFEGGLSLRLADLKEIGGVVRNLNTISVLITWGITAIAGHVILGLDWGIAALLGAILVVTGPTVVIPLLTQIRPVPKVSSILRWEGIIIDPVGAILTVLVFEEIVAYDSHLITSILNLLLTTAIGFSFGWFGAKLLVEAFSRHWVPEYLQNPVVLMAIVGLLTLANMLQPESGLLVVTIMGIFMANQSRFDVVHIIEFKENLQVLLISALFILLGARLEFEPFSQLGLGVVGFILVLMFLARPLAIFVASIGSDLTWREKLFLTWMAPRGIVAAAVASIFALELAQTGHEGAELLVPITFSVIISTVLIYSLTAGWVAKWLGLVQEDPQGVIFIGAHPWARRIAQVIHDLDIKVILIDTNRNNIRRAETEGLEAYHGSILNDTLIEDIDLNGIGNMIAITPNDEVNSLASLHFKDTISSIRTYQLPRQAASSAPTNVAMQLGGENLFGEKVTYDFLSQQFREDARLDVLEVDRAIPQNYEANGKVPLFVVSPEGKLKVWTANNPPVPQIGEKLVVVATAKSGEQEVVA